MDLAALGKIAGIAGIAVGMIVLLVRPLIERTSTLPPNERAPTFRLVTIGAFSIGGLGIVAWLLTGSAGVHVTGAPGSVTAGGNVSNSPVTNSGSPGGATAPAAKP